MTDRLLTPSARRYVTGMTAALAPFADRLDRRFRSLLRQRGYGIAQTRAFLAITPAAASRLRTLTAFIEQVGYHGRRLAKLNVEPGEVQEMVRAFDALMEALLPGKFEPAREQLYLATTLALSESFYQVREAETQAFFGLYRAEIEASSLDDMLRRFVRILTRTFHARGGRLLLDTQPGGKLARPLYIERGGSNEKLIADAGMRGKFESYWSFPIAQAAVIQFGFDVRYPWLPRELTLLQAVAERCRKAIEKILMEAQIRRLEAEAHRAEEEERRRIGRELHDEAGQSLLALRLQLELMERTAPADLRPRLAESRALAEHTVEELRRLIAALSPALLEKLGLKAAIRHLAARFGKVHSSKVQVRISGEWEGLPRPIQEVIYRVTQESLQNIAKHSKATRVNILLFCTDKKTRLRVSDNGNGFAKEVALSKPMSFGLAGMRERAMLLDGALTVRSTPGKGVTILLELPQTPPRG